MIEVSGIPSEDSENCVNIIKNICNLIDLNVENSIEIAHRIKNGDIIVKFRDRPSRNTLFRCKDKLKGKSTKDLGFKEERFIYINESLAFDNKKLLFNVRQKCRELGIKKVLTDNGIIKVKMDIPGSKYSLFLVISLLLSVMVEYFIFSGFHFFSIVFYILYFINALF